MMQSEIRSFVLELLKKKSRLPIGFDDTSDFISAGIIDSLAIIKFVLELEAKFNIEIADSDIESERFRSVDGLVTMIVGKAAAAK